MICMIMTMTIVMVMTIKMIIVKTMMRRANMRIKMHVYDEQHNKHDGGERFVLTVVAMLVDGQEKKIIIHLIDF